jgi:DNA-directed RNA polymerase specialized sigma subunit
MRYAPRKVFILEDGKYIETSYEKYQNIMEENPTRRFWLFGGMLMEVSEEDYVQMNREKSRMQYQCKMAKKMGEFSYDSVGADDFDGAMILENHSLDVSEVVEQRIMVDKLHEAMKELADEDAKLIKALFFDNVSEREYSREKGISHTAVQKRRQKALEKLRNMIGGVD